MEYTLKRQEAWKIINSYKRFSSVWHYKIIWWVMLETGRRLGEIIRLRLSDLNADFSEVNILLSKKKKPIYRRFILSEGLASELKLFVDNNFTCFRQLYLFPPRASKGLHLSSHSAGSEFCKVRSKLGLTDHEEYISEGGYKKKRYRVRTHSFRHTVAETLRKSCLPIEVASHFLAHTKISTTQVYFSQLAIAEESKNAVGILQDKLGFTEPTQKKINEFSAS